MSPAFVWVELLLYVRIRNKKIVKLEMPAICALIINVDQTLEHLVARSGTYNNIATSETCKLSNIKLKPSWPQMESTSLVQGHQQNEQKRHMLHSDQQLSSPTPTRPTHAFPPVIHPLTLRDLCPHSGPTTKH